ncbi:hypothetical protein ACROYT_G043479 [Oculina patagonica]
MGIFISRRRVVIILLAFLSLVSFLTPSYSVSVTDMCVTPVCKCSLDLVYNMTITCHTNDVKNDLATFHKEARANVRIVCRRS